MIIKYSGTLGQVREIAESVVELSNEFAIVTVREDRLEALAGIEAVEYIEKPKRLFFQVENGRVSCMTSVQIRPPKLYGAGVLVAIIDSGIDYANLDSGMQMERREFMHSGIRRFRKSTGRLCAGNRIHAGEDQ